MLDTRSMNNAFCAERNAANHSFEPGGRRSVRHRLVSAVPLSLIDLDATIARLERVTDDERQMRSGDDGGILAVMKGRVNSGGSSDVVRQIPDEAGVRTPRTHEGRMLYSHRSHTGHLFALAVRTGDSQRTEMRHA